MRIIAGSVGGRVLRAPKGMATRPTSDRVREAVFNILGPAAPTAVLDLYAGSGALGLEALSRGCDRAVFVEQHAPTARLIRENAVELGLDGKVDVKTQRVEDFLSRGQASASTFGWIFLDPPYADAKGLARALALVGPFLDDGGLVIAEHDGKIQPADAFDRLALCDRRRYGQCAVSFYSEGPT